MHIIYLSVKYETYICWNLQLINCYLTYICIPLINMMNNTLLRKIQRFQIETKISNYKFIYKTRRLKCVNKALQILMSCVYNLNIKTIKRLALNKNKYIFYKSIIKLAWSNGQNWYFFANYLGLAYLVLIECPCRIISAFITLTKKHTFI